MTVFQESGDWNGWFGSDTFKPVDVHSPSLVDFDGGPILEALP